MVHKQRVTRAGKETHVFLHDLRNPLILTLVCFVSDELIELETELAGDTLDGIRDDEMNVALNNIFQSNYDPHQVIKSVKMQNVIYIYDGNHLSNITI